MAKGEKKDVAWATNAILARGADQARNAAHAALAPVRAVDEFLNGEARANQGPYASHEPLLPPGESIERNMAIGRMLEAVQPGLGQLAFLAAVWPGSLLDYKKGGRRKYEDGGNYGFGALGAAVGLPPAALLRGAGAAQMVQHLLNPKAHPSHPEWGAPWGRAPYGDDPADREVIINGINRAWRERDGRGR